MRGNDGIFGQTAAYLWRSGYALLTFTALFWSGNAIVGRAARDLVPPVALSFWRWAIALLILIPFAWPYLRRDMPILLSRWPIMLVFGVLGIAVFNTLLYTGLHDTTAINALLIQSSQPALFLMFGVLMFRDKVSTRQIAGVIVSMAGVLTIIAHGNWNELVRLRLNGGDIIIAVAMLIWSFYSVLLRERPVVHPLSFLAATLIIGVAAMLPVYVMEIMSGSLIVMQSGSWLSIAYVAIFPSLLAYLCFNRGIELIGSASTGQYLNIMPIIGAGLAILFLGERLQLFHFIGIILVGAGIVLAGGNKKAI